MKIETLIKSYWPDVTRVVDAKRALEIEVTRADSRKATKKDHAHCAFARACERIPKVEAAIISTRQAYLKRGDCAVRYTVSEPVRMEIVSFDRHQDFSPGAYKLNAPSLTRRLGAQPKGKKWGRKTGERKKRIYHRTAGLRSALWGKAAP